MVSSCTALRQIQSDPFKILQPKIIQGVCDQLDYRWRSGPLDPVHTVALFVQQIALGNIPCTAVRHLSSRQFTDSAYCQARQRLPLQVLNELSRHVAAAVRERVAGEESLLWHGRQTWIVDGSTFSMPDTAALQERFGQPTGQKPGCGFPIAHLLVLFHRESGLLEQPVISPLYTSDQSTAPRVHEKLKEGDVLLGDDAFSSWGHYALCSERKLHLVTPPQHRRILSFTPHRPYTTERKMPVTGMARTRWIKSLGHNDQLVEWFKPRERPAWMSREKYAALPKSIVVREIRRVVRRKGFRSITITVVTTLLDPQIYPANEVVALRKQRWMVEINLRHLKTTMGMDVLHCKTVDGVQKEAAVFVLVYNLTRAVMLEAASLQNVPLDRLSFADVLHWLRHAREGDEMPQFVVNPDRPGRVEPRVIKRRAKPYDLMMKPRKELRNLLKEQNKAA